MKRERSWGLPLLAKELTEQAARKRTYAMRVAYACLLFAVVYYIFADQLDNTSGNLFSVLGQGRDIFETILWFQFWSITLLMPALASGTISREKETNSLEQLILTRLGPMTIIAEKLLSRLVPMLTFLFLSLPLMAFAYTLGGVTLFEFWGALILLSLYALQCGALAVMCSAFFSTTVAAFIASYVLTFLSFGCCLFGIFSEFESVASLVVGGTVVLVFASGFYFMCAVGCLIGRASSRPRNYLLEFFKKLDKSFEQMNRVTGNVVLLKSSSSLPEYNPIAWRETSKKSLGTFHYLFRVLIAIEIPCLAAALMAAPTVYDPGLSAYSSLLCVLWVIAILFVVVKATSLLASERSAQTLNVLLACPLTGSEIIRQKCSGVRRLISVMCLPLLTTIVFRAFFSLSLGYLEVGQLVLYIAASVGTLLLYLPVISWVSFWISLMIRSQARATMLSLVLILAWVFLPLALMDDGTGISRYVASPNLHPSTFVLRNEMKTLSGFNVVANLLFHCSLYVLLRSVCLRKADRLLGRMDPAVEPPPDND